LSRVRDLEIELEKAKAETDALKKELAEAHQVAMFQAGTASVSPPRMILQRPGVAGAPPQPPVKPTIIPPQTSPRLTPAAQPPSKIGCAYFFFTVENDLSAMCHKGQNLHNCDILQ
jgi:hypothetical protein